MKRSASEWPCLDPGELRHQITILSSQNIQDVSGTAVQMVPFVRAYAKIEPTSGSDLAKAGQITTQIAITVSILWQSGIRSDMQIDAPGGRRYIIRAVENVRELNVTLKMICVALGDNQ